MCSSDLAVIPAGTGRDFARTAGLPRKPEKAARRIARDSSTQRIDVGSVVLADGSEHLYLNVASFGVSARIAHALEAFPELKRRAGALAFGLATVRAGLGYSPDLVDLRVDDGEVQIGVWEATPGEQRGSTGDYDEVMLMVDGRGSVEHDDSDVVERVVLEAAGVVRVGVRGAVDEARRIPGVHIHVGGALADRIECEIGRAHV